jgi:hypothetical protein
MTSERTDEIFWSKHRLDDRLVAALTDEEIERIEAIAQGRVDSPNRVRALDVLAAARGAEAVGALTDTARDESLDSTLRSAAVIHLGRIGGPQAEKVLIGLARETRDPSVRMRVAQALAKTGSPDALTAFDALVEDEEPRVRRRAAFARSVLAYRHGIAGFELPAPAYGDLIAFPHSHGLPVRSERAPLEEAARALHDLRRDSYGLQLARDDAYAIDCGPTRMLLALEAHTLQTASSAFGDRPRLLGLVAERSPEDGSYSVKWLVFSTPAEGGARLAVHRQTGEQVLYGSVDGGSGSGRFELRSVAAIGNPAATVAGEFGDGRFSLSGTSAASVGVAGGRGKNFALPDETQSGPAPEWPQ